MILALAAMLIVGYPGHRTASAAAGSMMQASPTFSINNVSSAEGHTGKKTFTFTVTLSAAAADVEHRVSYATADGTASGTTFPRTAATAISIPIIGTASPYPIALEVSGLSGTIDDVAVRLNNLTHTYPEDLDVLLVGPGGQSSMFMSDVGGWGDVANVNLAFRDGALPPPDRQLLSGTFAPTNISPNESLPGPAPTGPYAVALSGFNGTNPNGTWRLYIEDDFTTDVGALAGFTLDFSLSGTGDYLPSAGELVFPPGVTSLPVTVSVKGDDIVEPTETFAVNLSAPVNAVIGDGQGIGTIFNDDGAGVPIATDDRYLVALNAPLTVPAPGVLGNDDSNRGGAMTAMLAVNVAHGTLALGPGGGFVYTPAPGYAGPDSFVYRASNASGSSNDAIVTLAVGVPATAGDAATTPGNTLLSIAAPGVLGNDNSNDGGPMTATLVSSVSRGSLALNPDGGFVYAPAPDFVGIDTFTYRAVTSRGAGNVATVTITVVPPTNAQPPTGLRVDSVVGSTVTVRFFAPVLGPPPTQYVLKGGVLPGQVLAAFATGSDAPIFRFEAPTGSFFIRMHGVAGGAESAASNEVPLHVNVPVTPTPPANLVGLVNGSTVTLAWKNTFGGGAPTNMILGVRGDLTLDLPIGLGETFSFEDVPPGQYTLRVREANRGGWSPSSNPVTLTFPGPCSGAPLPPANFLAHTIGNTIFVRWDPAATGPAPTAFTLNVTGALVASFTTGGRELSGAVGPGAYKLEVAAQNPCGTSAAAVPQTIVVP